MKTKDHDQLKAETHLWHHRGVARVGAPGIGAGPVNLRVRLWRAHPDRQSLLDNSSLVCPEPVLAKDQAQLKARHRRFQTTYLVVSPGHALQRRPSNHLRHFLGNRKLLQENATLFQLFLCLSRACLGEMFVCIYKWLKKTVFPLPAL